MKKFDSEHASKIKSFVVNGVGYTHMIDLTNDSVYLIDEEMNILLEFTSNSVILDLTAEPQRTLGRFQLRQNNWWLIDDIQGTETMGTSFNDPDGLLKDEVAFSKQWLANKDKYAAQVQRDKISAERRRSPVLAFEEPLVRIKTAQDEERLRLAQQKRDRKAAKRVTPQPQLPNS
jgi:hypothetical protein